MNAPLQEILEYTKKLNSETRQIYTYLDIYRNLQNNLNSHHKIYCSMPIFFKKVMEALQDSIIIGTAKLFEDSRQVLSINKLYNICSQHKLEFPANRYNEDGSDSGISYDINMILIDMKIKLDDSSKPRKSIKALRDQLWAHRDKKYVLDASEVFENNPLTWGDIECLLGIASEFTQNVLLGLTNSRVPTYYSTPDSCKEDVERLINLIDKGMNMEVNRHGSHEI